MAVTVLSISKLRRLVLAVAVVGLWLGGPAALLRAQAPADSFTDEVEVRDARVDVVVSDADGYPVLGLTREDFELLVDGQPVPVTQLVAFEKDSALRVEGSNPARRTDLEAEERLFLAVFLDRTFLAPGDLRVTVEQLTDFLTTLRPRDRVMLVTADPRLELLESLEEGPPGVIIAALEDLVEAPASGKPFLTDYRDLLDDLSPTRAPGAQGPIRAKTTLARVEAFAAEGQLRMQRAAANLHRLIDQVAGLPGRRVVLYIGGRLPIGLGQELLTAWERSYGESSALARLPEAEGGLDAGTESLLYKSLPRVPDRGADRDLFADIGRHANLAQVVLVPVDPAALRSSPAFISRTGVQRLGAGGDPSIVLAEMAMATGGRLVGEQVRESPAWDPLSRELASFYRLIFTPPAGAEGSEYRLEVRLRPPRPGVDLRHPTSVAFASLDQEALDRVRAAVVLGAEHNVLGIDLSVVEVERGPDGIKARIKVRIPLPNLALVPSGEHHLGRLSVFVLAASWNGASSAPLKAVLPIRLSREELLASLAGPVGLTVEVLLPPGAESVGVGVRDHFASVFATAVVELPELPTGPGTPAAVGP